MFTFTVTKFDSKLNLKNSCRLELIETFDTACLLNNSGNFLTLLADNRSGVPESINIKCDCFRKGFKLPEKYRFDFSDSKAWSSDIKCKIFKPRKKVINLIEKHVKKKKNKIRSLKKLEDLITKASLRDIIGMGRGLTPSGDDFLVGSLNTTAAFSKKLFKKLSSEISPGIEKTTSLSRHFLELALKKRAGEDIISLLKAIAAGNEKNIDKYSENILNIGATSGYYTLRGIAWALKKIL
ncbi:MAG: DUF2877 domain-containing protein [Elusimicrobia bacterium]|nr:DUF2877 domain-containing protein [Elusimicrobiota bacterium]